MNDDLIRRSDAIKVLKPFERNVDMMIDWLAKTYVKEVINGIMDGIKTIEPKCGRWIWQSSMAGSFTERRYKCSNCQYEITTQREEPIYNFCPNCGCWMKGDKE